MKPIIRRILRFSSVFILIALAIITLKLIRIFQNLDLLIQ